MYPSVKLMGINKQFSLLRCKRFQNGDLIAIQLVITSNSYSVKKQQYN